MKTKNKFWIYPLLAMGFILLLIGSCKKKDDNNNPTGQVPVLTTSAVTAITQTNALCGGNITSDGGATITARGVCWSTGQTPTIADSKTTDGTGAGSYTSAITDLSPNTKYYVRAYATNSAGTGYGSAMSFVTQPGNYTVTDIDGNIYHTVTIGTQVWMIENLKVTRYRNGDPIPNITDGSAWSNHYTGAYCDYDNTPGNSTIYGKLYNWFAVNDNRNLAPTGWHIPTDAEWLTMITFLGGESVAGGKLKETGTSHWQSPNTGATNETGFTARPGGYRNYDGTFNCIWIDGNWWTSTERSTSEAYGRAMHYGSSNANGGYNFKEVGCSVRCIKD